MSQREVSNDERDPSLTKNCGCFVDGKKLEDHIEAHKGQPQEVSKHYSPFIHYELT